MSLAALIYPWLHAGAPGPAPAVEPWLVSLLCVAVMVALLPSTPGARMPRGAAIAAITASGMLWLGNALARGSLAITPAVASTWLTLALIASGVMLGATARAGDGTTGRWRTSLLAWGWLIAALASTLIALAQYFGYADALGPLAAHSRGHQAFANLRQKNLFASLAAIGLLSLFWLLLHASARWQRALAAAGALLLCAGLAISASRTGALQLVALLAAWFWWRRGSAFKWGWVALPVIGFVGVAVALLLADPAGHAVPSLLKRLTGDAPDCQGRQVLWSTMGDLIAQRPWTGWGWRELPYAAYASDSHPRFCAIVENAHNLPVHLAVELGLVIALVFCAACIWFVLRSRPWAAADASVQLGWGVLLLLGIHSLLEYPLWYGPFQMALGLALGLVWPQDKVWRVGRPALAAAGACLLAIGLYAALDYRRVSQLYLPSESRWPSLRQDTLVKVRSSWIFQGQVAFAELIGTPLTPQTAQRQFDLSGRVLHFSPEARVIERRIASAQLLGRSHDAAAEIARYQRAFPAHHARWSATQATAP